MFGKRSWKINAITMKKLFSRVLKGPPTLGLECRAIKYEQPTTTTASTSTTTLTTLSTLPTTSQSRDSFDGPIYSPIGDHLTEDPYPICNVPAPGAIEIIFMTVAVIGSIMTTLTFAVDEEERIIKHYEFDWY